MNKSPFTFVRATILITAGLVAGCQSTTENHVDDVRISPKQMMEMLSKNPDRYLVVDARQAELYAQARIPGAIRMDPPELNPEDPDPKFNEYKAVIVYGDDPAYGRSNALTKRFIQAGIDVYMLDGGMKTWREAGNPIDTKPR